MSRWIGFERSVEREFERAGGEPAREEQEMGLGMGMSGMRRVMEWGWR